MTPVSGENCLFALSEYLSSDDSRYLVKLCEAGRLYEVEQWIQAGKSLKVSRELNKTLLSVAVSSGFHSMVELLLRHDRQSAKDSLSDTLCNSDGQRWPNSRSSTEPKSHRFHC
jgi:hypothetical protein